ncbi:hypothetical protein Tco_0531941 [Tanacetum coccineum]
MANPVNSEGSLPPHSNPALYVDVFHIPWTDIVFKDKIGQGSYCSLNVIYIATMSSQSALYKSVLVVVFVVVVTIRRRSMVVKMVGGGCQEDEDNLVILGSYW